MLLGAAFKGASVANHPRGVEQEACLTAQDLQDALWEYVLNIYRWKEHEGLTEAHGSDIPLCPAGVFENYVANGGWIEVVDDAFRVMGFLSTVECAVQDYGINVDRRVYNSSGLRELAWHLKPGIGLRARKVTVFFDRSDATRVYVKHPLTREWLCTPRANQPAAGVRPYGDLMTRAIRDQAARGERPPLNPTEQFDAEVRLHKAWGRGEFKDRRDMRLASIEASRTRDYARDLADSTAELRTLAFGDDQLEPDAPTYDGGSAPEDLLDYDEIDVEDPVL
jgi:hypothetical protein